MTRIWIERYPGSWCKVNLKVGTPLTFRGITRYTDYTVEDETTYTYSSEGPVTITLRKRTRVLSPTPYPPQTSIDLVSASEEWFAVQITPQQDGCRGEFEPIFVPLWRAATRSLDA